MKQIIKQFENSIKNNRLSHLYLLTGAPSDVLSEVAFKLSYLILRKDNDEDNLEQKILNRNYPNFISINKEGNTLRKEQILNLQNEFSKTSLINGERVYVILDAETMSQAAANSLLKFLEEPQSNKTVGFLVTDNINMILPTIISRSQVILINYEKEEFINQLIKESVEPKNAYFIAELTQNIEEIYEILDSQLYLESIKYIDLLIEWIIKRNNNLYLLTNEIANKFREEKEYLIFILKIFSNILLDVIHTHMHQDIYYSFYKETILELVRIINLKTSENVIKEVNQTIRYLNTNANSIMLIQSLSIRIKEIFENDNS